ncbi:MAG: MBL fold metallo-hydrolase [Bacillota bacterium]
MLTAAVWGGAGEHGRSCYHIECGGVSVLLDCGVKKTGIGEYPLFDRSKVSSLSTVFLSHAHEDHSMAIPILYRMGYEGEVWTTRATLNQLPAYYEAWEKQVRSKGGVLPYEKTDRERVRYRCMEESVAAGTWFETAPGIRVCWGPSGHLAGSIWLLIEMGGQRVFYSGDYCGESSLLQANLPSGADLEDISLAIVDAAYGSRPEVQEQELQRLLGTISEVSDRGGHVLLPVPVYGRGQELLPIIAASLPEIPIVCEETLLHGFRELAVFQDWLKPGALERTWQAIRSVAAFVADAEEVQAALAGPPSIFFAPDGLLQTAIARQYYRALSEDPRHAILFTGHLYEGSFGAKVWRKHNGMDKTGAATLFGCEVQRFQYKVHQGLPDVRRMLDRIRPLQTLLVHADKGETDLLATRLVEEGFTGLHSLVPGKQLLVV